MSGWPQLLDEVFGVTISEGAIANLLARAEAPLTAAATTIAREVRNAKVVASDETSARVGGKTWWQWVLLSSTAVYHVIAPHRSAAVVSDFSWAASSSRSGSLTVTPHKPAMAPSAKSASPICCATPSSPSTPAMLLFRRRLSKAAVAIDRYWSAPRRI